MFTAAKEFHFSASHQLTHLPADHQCARLHGHNYIVEVTLASATCNADGFVLDYGELAPLKQYIDQTFDHRHLNTVLGDGRATTAELLARHFYEWAKLRWPEVTQVRISETPKTWSSYSEGTA